MHTMHMFLHECILFTLQRTIIGCNCHYMVRFSLQNFYYCSENIRIA